MCPSALPGPPSRLARPGLSRPSVNQPKTPASTSTAQIDDSSFEQPEDLWIGSIPSGRLTEHTDPPSLGAFRLQERRISRRDPATQLRGRWVRRVDTGDNVEQLHKVSDGAGHRTCSVALVVKAQSSRSGKPTPNACADQQWRCWRRDSESSQRYRTQGPQHQSSQRAPLRCHRTIRRLRRRCCKDCAQSSEALN